MIKTSLLIVQLLAEFRKFSEITERLLCTMILRRTSKYRPPVYRALITALTLLLLPIPQLLPAQQPLSNSELKEKMIVSGPVPLNPEKTVILDVKNKKLVLECTTCLEQGVLEMFLCPKQTKEHESIVSLDAKMAVVHAGLLALGAKPGTPVSYHPEYKPPTGQKLDIYMTWTDAEGKPNRFKAQQLIRNVTYRYFEEPLAAVPQGVVIDEGENSLRYDKTNKLLLWFGHMTQAKKTELLAMSDDAEYQTAINKMFDDSQFTELKADFVFVGSKFSQLEDGTNLYQAEMGSGICVANFSDSMIDINIESSASDSNRLYEPYTERLPPTGTKVTVELIPDETKEPPLK